MSDVGQEGDSARKTDRPPAATSMESTGLSHSDHSTGNQIKDSGDSLGSIAGNALHAFAYSLQSTINGPVQIWDKVTGTNILPHLQLASAPEATRPYSWSWFAQQVGSGIGMLPGLTLASRLTSRAGSAMPAIYDSATAARAAAAAGTEGAALAAAPTLQQGLWHSAKTGLVFSGILSQSSNDSSGIGNFALDRGKQAVMGAATFATLGGSYFALNRYLNLNQFASNLTSGLLVGGASADANALLSGRQASWDERLQSGLSFAVAGIAMPLASEWSNSAVNAAGRQLNHPALAPYLRTANDVINLLPGRGMSVSEYLKRLEETHPPQATALTKAFADNKIDTTLLNNHEVVVSRFVEQPRIESSTDPLSKGKIYVPRLPTERWSLVPKSNPKFVAHEGGHVRPTTPGQVLGLEGYINSRVSGEAQARSTEQAYLKHLGQHGEAEKIQLKSESILADAVREGLTYKDLYTRDYHRTGGDTSRAVTDYMNWWPHGANQNQRQHPIPVMEPAGLTQPKFQSARNPESRFQNLLKVCICQIKAILPTPS